MMLKRKLAVLTVVFAAVVVVFAIRLRAKADLLSIEWVQHDGLIVRASSERPDRTAEVLGVITYKFHVKAPDRNRTLNMYVDRFHDRRLVGTVIACGIGPTLSNDSLEHEFTVMVLPMGEDFYKAEKIKICAAIDSSKPSSVVLDNPLRGHMSMIEHTPHPNPNDACFLMGAGKHTVVSFPERDDEALSVRLEARQSPPMDLLKR